MSSRRRKFRRFLASWGRDLAIATGGALTGLAVAVALGVGGKGPDHAAASLAPVQPASAAYPSATRTLPVTRPHAAPVAPPGENAPVQGRSGLPAWQRFAALSPDPGGRPMIAVIIDDMGVDRGRSARAIRLQAPVTLSFLPYARDLDRQVEAARRAGHELMVHMPMEPDSDTVDPGPDVLRTDETPEDIRARLDQALRRFTGYVGLNNHMGSRFTADAAAMRIVLGDIAHRGLLFVDSRTTKETVAPEVARTLGVPFAQRDVFLDDVPTRAAVMEQLHRLESVARRKGYAIAIGHPKDATLDALAGWLWGLDRRGYALVPVSAIVRRNRREG